MANIQKNQRLSNEKRISLLYKLQIACFPVLILATFYVNMSGNASEICADGIDNDGDGLVDCQDGDCADFAGCLDPDVCTGLFKLDCNKSTVEGPSITAILTSSTGICLQGAGCSNFDDALWIANQAGTFGAESFSVTFSAPVNYLEIWGYGLTKDPNSYDADEYAEIFINNSFYKLAPVEAHKHAGCYEDDHLITTESENFPGIEGVWRAKEGADADGKLILKYPAGISSLHLTYHNVSGASSHGAAFLVYFSDPGPCTSDTEWLSFNGQQVKEQVVLNWETASEQNKEYFEIQRSEDGETFETIGQIKAYGFSQSINHYKFVDKDIASLESPLLFYQLNQVNFDGTSKLSKRLEVEVFEPSTEPIISAYYP